MTAEEALRLATDTIAARARERDRKGGERSMQACVMAFNAITGGEMTELEGWTFMVCLKLARANGGAFKADDYVDMAAYAALALESQQS